MTRRAGRSGGVDRLGIAFDDDRLVAGAGLVLPAMACERLGAEALPDGTIGRVGAAQIEAAASAKALTIAFAMLAGGDAIDEVVRQVDRSGQRRQASASRRRAGPNRSTASLAIPIAFSRRSGTTTAATVSGAPVSGEASVTVAIPAAVVTNCDRSRRGVEVVTMP